MDNNREETSKGKNSNLGCIVFFILFAITVFFVWKIIFGNPSTSTIGKNGKPDEVELMTYAQTILDDNLSNPKYSSNKSDYTFVETKLRYKIEGNVTENGIKQRFYMIIEFDDENYKDYKLISLQVGNNRIY